MVFGLKYLAISGSVGPQSSLNDLTAFSCLTSRTMHGPVVMCSTIPTNSGKTPLYTSKNSSAVGLSRPSWTICGLMTQQVQLLKAAVGAKFLPKNNSDSL